MIEIYNPQLETFLCVADAGSFNKAAKKMHISLPSVIKQINSLEERIGLQLFIRTRRGLVLTGAGKSLYQDTKNIIQYCKASVERAKDAMPGRDETIYIGISPMTPEPIIVDLWPRIQKYCPDMHFELLSLENRKEGLKGFLNDLVGHIDMVTGVFDDVMLNEYSYAALQISSEPICCALSVHHSLAQKEMLTVQDLYQKQFLLPSQGQNYYVDLLRKDLQKEHPQIQIEDFESYHDDVFQRCANNQCMLMAIKQWRFKDSRLKILPVDWNYTIPFGLIYSPEASPVLQRVLQAAEIAVKE